MNGLYHFHRPLKCFLLPKFCSDFMFAFGIRVKNPYSTFILIFWRRSTLISCFQFIVFVFVLIVSISIMTGNFIVGSYPSSTTTLLILFTSVLEITSTKFSINCGNASQAVQAFVVYKMFESYHFDQSITKNEKQGQQSYNQLVSTDQERYATFHLNNVTLGEIASKIDQLNLEQFIDDRGKKLLIKAMKQGFYKSSYHTNFMDGSIVHGLVSAVQLPRDRYTAAGTLLKFRIKDQKGFRKLSYDQLADLFNYAEYKSADQFRVEYKETLDSISDTYSTCFG